MMMAIRVMTSCCFYWLISHHCGPSQSVLIITVITQMSTLKMPDVSLILCCSLIRAFTSSYFQGPCVWHHVWKPVEGWRLWKYPCLCPWIQLPPRVSVSNILPPTMRGHYMILYVKLALFWTGEGKTEKKTNYCFVFFLFSQPRNPWTVPKQVHPEGWYRALLYP